MKTFVILSTYNEKGNIGHLIEQIFFYCPNCEIVVADDDSPDGTWRVVEEMQKRYPRLHLLHRMKERGRGLAGIAGYQYAIEHGAEAVCEMDADFSHSPSSLPDFFRAIEDWDVVSGSRFLPGGGDPDRSRFRRLITFLANRYIRRVLRLKQSDCTSGYRCFRSEVLKNMDLRNMISTGPSIVQETLLRASQMGYQISEIPIVLRNRAQGKTKLTLHRLINVLIAVFRLRFVKSSVRRKTVSGNFV